MYCATRAAYSAPVMAARIALGYESVVHVRKVRCRTCGAPKVTAPRTAYVYCDYCSTWMDWDFQIACATAGSQHPGPAYEGLRQMLHPKLEAARRSNDLAALRD